MKSSIEAVFIDRDGTIGGTGHFIHPNNFSLFPFTLEAIQKLKSFRMKVFAFTNQYRISRGDATYEEFEKQFRTFGFDDSFICPHEINENCICRKPNIGMLLEAARKYNLDLNKCVVIGDVGDTDMLAAHRVNAMKILVRTGWGNESLGQYRSNWLETSPDYIAENLLDAVEWISRQ
ncbi:HAD-IIIA family hydrolase [Paenibacillus yanchengensis]|uniref:D,D-heptose 1,7-bisphosphate phosphatase n=1 Tax=Paenibacillus yanchengensis TaxID=2035833 RepID=A0ABW4YLT4_9BACL